MLICANTSWSWRATFIFWTSELETSVDASYYGAVPSSSSSTDYQLRHIITCIGSLSFNHPKSQTTMAPFWSKMSKNFLPGILLWKDIDRRKCCIRGFLRTQLSNVMKNCSVGHQKTTSQASKIVEKTKINFLTKCVLKKRQNLSYFRPSNKHRSFCENKTKIVLPWEDEFCFLARRQILFSDEKTNFVFWREDKFCFVARRQVLFSGEKTSFVFKKKKTGFLSSKNRKQFVFKNEKTTCACLGA